MDISQPPGPSSTLLKMLTWRLPSRILSYHYQEGPDAYEDGTSCTFLSFIIDFLQHSDLHLHQPQVLSSNGSSLNCMCDFSLYLPPTPAPFPPSWPRVRSKASDSSHHFKTDGHLSQALQASIQARRPRSCPARKVTSPLTTSVFSPRRGVVNPALPAQN